MAVVNVVDSFSESFLSLSTHGYDLIPVVSQSSTKNAMVNTQQSVLLGCCCTFCTENIISEEVSVQFASVDVEVFPLYIRRSYQTT